MSDPLAAPPPYALSPKELDRKVDAVLQESIAVMSNQVEMEDYDEAAFEAAFEAAAQAARLSEDVGGSYTDPAEKAYSALPSAEPLRINKKAKFQPPSTSSKDWPYWLEEAGLEGSSSSCQEDARPLPFTHTASVNNPSSSSVFVSSHQLALDEEEDRSIAPPPFTAVGPSLDGPPFEEIDTAYLHNPHASPPPSPLVSPTVIHPLLPTPLIMSSSLLLQPNSRRSPPRQSLPAPLRTYVSLGPRPASSAGNRPKPLMTAPVVGFDPSMVYTKPRNAASPGAQLRANEAGSFYNSAVAPHVTNWASRPSLNPVTHPSQRPRASAGGFGHSALDNENDWARNLYDQYPSNPINTTPPFPPALPVAPEHPQYQLQQYQPQQYRRHPDPRMRPTSSQGQWPPRQ